MEDSNMVATKKLFENDKVIIWEMRLEPGQRGELHKHRYDHVLVQISGDRMAVEPDPSTKSIFKDYIEADISSSKKAASRPPIMSAKSRSMRSLSN